MIPFYIGLRSFTYCAFSPRFHMTETTQGNFNAKLTVFILAWNMNLKCFWFADAVEDDILIFYYQ